MTSACWTIATSSTSSPAPRTGSRRTSGRRRGAGPAGSGHAATPSRSITSTSRAGDEPGSVVGPGLGGHEGRDDIAPRERVGSAPVSLRRDPQGEDVQVSGPVVAGATAEAHELAGVLD